MFDTEHFVVKKRKNIEDSLEIYIKDEFLGLIYEEIDENEKAYQFHMTILDEDLKMNRNSYLLSFFFHFFFQVYQVITKFIVLWLKREGSL